MDQNETKTTIEIRRGEQGFSVCLLREDGSSTLFTRDHSRASLLAKIEELLLREGALR